MTDVAIDHAPAEKSAVTDVVSKTVVPASTSASDSNITNSESTPRLFVEFAPAAAADDETLVAALTGIVNAVYSETEGGIYVKGYQRTDANEIRQFIRAEEIGVAWLSSPSDPARSQQGPIGCIRVQKLSNTLGSFGMMSVDAQYRGGGYGRDMVRWAEEHCRSQGLDTMQLELLVPQGFEHAFKKRLQDWYLRMGYVLIKLGDFQQEYPHLARLLRGPTEYRVFEKMLV